MSYSPPAPKADIDRAVRKYRFFFAVFVALFVIVIYILHQEVVAAFYGRELWVIGYYISFGSLLSASFFDISKNASVKSLRPIGGIGQDAPTLKRVRLWQKVEKYLNFLWIIGFVFIFVSEFWS